MTLILIPSPIVINSTNINTLFSIEEQYIVNYDDKDGVIYGAIREYATVR